MQLKLVNRFNTFIVAVYKAMGSVALALILLGLVSYLGVQGFFTVGHSWVAPTILSPTDERILTLNTKLAQQSVERDRLMAERRELEGKLEEADRIIATQRVFQNRFAEAVKDERDARARELKRLTVLQEAYQTTQEEILDSNRAYAGLTRNRAEALKAARLLAREAYLTQNYQLAQMAQANLAFSENEVGLQGRVEGLRRELGSLSFLASRAPESQSPVRLTTNVLMLDRERLKSELEVSRAQQTRAATKAGLEAVDRALKRYEDVLKAIEDSPYLRAISRNVTVAFVPYENLDNAAPGTPLYGCSLGLLWCRQVGAVREVLEGEVVMKHPIRHTLLRGVMVEVELQEPEWARKELLHAARPPLLF
ncbi:MAG: hypothetical protein L0Y66_15725 [Myxococcaceae bacterium]|nr:hypothetical protein [Myxococcaceae bacterium]MCI0674035.1 hypothetical protein [Myxococcaceae bacterium]